MFILTAANEVATEANIWGPLFTFLGIVFTGTIGYLTWRGTQRNTVKLDEAREALITNGDSNGLIGVAVDNLRHAVEDNARDNTRQHREIMTVVADVVERLDRHITESEQARYEQELRRAGRIRTRSTDSQ